MVILIGLGITIYVAVGGARIALEVQRVVGIPATWNNLISEDLWRQYESRFEEIYGDIEQMIREDFTEEQALFIGDTLSDSMENWFTPDRLSVQFFLDIDEEDLTLVVDEAFDAVIAEGRADLSSAKVNALREEVQLALTEFGVGAMLPQVINFVILLAFLPALIVLVYGLGEAAFGRSLGKLVLGIAIRRDDGEPGYAGNYMLRFAIKNSTMILLVLALILRSPGIAVAAAVSAAVLGISMLAILGPQRKALYDHVARTSVVDVRLGDSE